jgi:toxin ParE1/3/4
MEPWERSVQVLFTQAAKLEFEDAIAWYRERDAAIAAAFRNDVLEAARKIGADPRRFKTVLGDVRQVVLGRFPYSLLYFIGNARVEVLAVFHERRDPMIWMRRT